MCCSCIQAMAATRHGSKAAHEHERARRLFQPFKACMGSGILVFSTDHLLWPSWRMLQRWHRPSSAT